MKAGQELDILVARKLWRAIVVSDTETGEHYMVAQKDGGKVPVPPFSTNTPDAYKVVEKMGSKGWTLRVKSISHEGTFHASFYKGDDDRVYKFHKGTTVEEAICVAAIAAIANLNVV